MDQLGLVAGSPILVRFGSFCAAKLQARQGIEIIYTILENPNTTQIPSARISSASPLFIVRA